MEILSLGWRLSSLCPSELPLPWLGPAGTGRLSKDTARLVSSLASWPHSHLCVPCPASMATFPPPQGGDPVLGSLVRLPSVALFALGSQLMCPPRATLPPA